jgi:hypothetical protein
MAKKNSTRRTRGIASKLYSPVADLLDAIGDTVEVLGVTAGKIANNVITGANRIGDSWASSLNSAISLKRRSRRNNSRKN